MHDVALSLECPQSGHRFTFQSACSTRTWSSSSIWKWRTGWCLHRTHGMPSSFNTCRLSYSYGLPAFSCLAPSSLVAGVAW